MLDVKKINYGYLFVSLILVIIIFVILFLYAITFNKTRDRYTELYVVGRFGDKHKAGKILYQLNKIAFDLFEYMNKTYHKREARVVIERLMHNYDPDKLEENDPKDPFTYKAFTMNFKNIAICLRKKDGRFYDMSTLIFVFLHELAHVGSLEQDHTHKFWTTFKFILVAAQSSGLYKPIDYSKKAMEYCGTIVNHNPFYDIYDIYHFV